MLVCDVVVSTMAGSGVAGYVDGVASIAMFSIPWGVSADSNGALFVADQGNNKIRKVTTAGEGGRGVVLVWGEGVCVLVVFLCSWGLWLLCMTWIGYDECCVWGWGLLGQ